MDIVETLLSAFAGAFFAYLFVRIGEFFSKIYERQKIHYNTLVLLATQLNKNYGILEDNKYLIPNFIQTIQDGKIYQNKIHMLDIDEVFLKDLFSIKLINNLFSLQYDYRKANEDADTINDINQNIRDMFRQRILQEQDKEGIEEYKQNTNILVNNLRLYEKILVSTQTKTLILHAIVRLKLKKEIPLFTKFLGLLLGHLEWEPSKDEINKEVIQLETEIKTSTETSVEEINKALDEITKEGDIL